MTQEPPESVKVKFTHGGYRPNLKWKKSEEQLIFNTIIDFLDKENLEEKDICFNNPDYKFVDKDRKRRGKKIWGILYELLPHRTHQVLVDPL